MSVVPLVPQLVRYDQGDDERALLAAIVTDPECLRFAVPICSPADFADTRLGALYGLLVAMKADSMPITATAVAGQAHSRRTLVRHLNASEIADLFAIGATSTSARYHAERVRTHAVVRDSQKAMRHGYSAMADAEDPAVALAATITRLQQIRDAATAGEVDVPLLGDLRGLGDDYDWLIPGLIERRDRFVLTGGEGGGKTTLLRQMMLLMNAGLHPFKLTAITPVEVLVIDVENTKRQWDRQTKTVARKAAHFGARDPDQHMHVECRGRMDLTKDRDLGEVHRMLDEYEPDVLAIGPLYKLVARAITTDDDAAPLIAALDSIRDRGITLLMEAHAGHGKDGAGARDLRPRGSSALLGWPEFGYGITAPKDDPMVVELIRWRGDREKRDWPTKLWKTDSAWPFVDCDLHEPFVKQFRS